MREHLLRQYHRLVPDPLFRDSVRGFGAYILVAK